MERTATGVVDLIEHEARGDLMRQSSTSGVLAPIRSSRWNIASLTRSMLSRSQIRYTFTTSWTCNCCGTTPPQMIRGSQGQLYRAVLRSSRLTWIAHQVSKRSPGV